MSEVAIEYDDPVEEAPEVAEEPTETPEPTPEPEASQETPEEPSEPSVPEFSPEQQAFINDKIIGRVTARHKSQLSEAEQRAQELEQRLQAIEQSQPQVPQGDPEPTPPQDIWADDYDQKQAQFLKDHADWAKREAKREFEAEQVEQQQAYEQQQQEAAQYQKVVSYSERAKTLGIAESDLQVAGNAVNQVGISDELIDYILEDDQGPGITMYLAKNLAELSALQSKSPMQAAVYLETTIKPRVTRSIKRNNPPEPAEPVKGAALPVKERGPEGATFE